MASEAMAASKWPQWFSRSNWPQIWNKNLKCPDIHVHIASDHRLMAILVASEAMVASKWPQRSKWPQYWTQWPLLPMFQCFSGLWVLPWDDLIAMNNKRPIMIHRPACFTVGKNWGSYGWRNAGKLGSGRFWGQQCQVCNCTSWDI